MTDKFRLSTVCALLCAFASCAFGQRVVNLHVTSRIQSRFATTHVTSEIVNTASEDKEITFEAQLPGEAFISNFTMKINGEWQVGKVKEKKEAKRDYDRAKAGGHTAGLVAQKPRETDRFETSVNVPAGGKVKFDLTYQEVLKRVHGVYKHVINILSVEEVEDLKIDVFISERGRIRDIHVPKFGPKIGEKTNKELLALAVNPEVTVRNTTSDDGFATANISYQPTTKVAGQLAVLYDLERAFNGGEIEVVDGYFVHFFSPQRDSGVSTDNSPLNGATNIVFVLDRSGSMQGKKFQQLKEAMRTILADLKAEDRFSIVWFSTEAEAWDQSLRDASADNIQQALNFVNGGAATGGTNVHGALIEALNILKNDKEATGNAAPNMVLFLTDGLPTAGEIQDPDDILKAVGSRNQNLKVKIHNLAFGNDADYKMLQKMSSENDGLARKIYEASDAKFQLEGFYSEIANPIFTNLDIKYLNGTVDVSTIVKNRNDNTFYDGGEVMVVGKLSDPAIETVRGEIAATGPDGASSLFRCGNECFGCCRGICPRWCQPWHPCPPIPRPQRIEPTALPANTLRGFVERMWGYMTIKNLLKEAGFEDNKADAQKKKDEALKLSLHYNFVTELTSMVVVDKEADLAPVEEEADEPKDFFSRSRLVASGGASFFGAPGAARSFGLPGPPALARPRPHQPAPPPMPTAMPIYPTSTFPPPTPTTTLGANVCHLRLLILIDQRSQSSVTKSQVFQFLNKLAGVQPEILGTAAVAQILDSQAFPEVLQDFSNYRRISSLPSQQPVGVASYSELLQELGTETEGKNIVLILNGQQLLSDSIRRELEEIKLQGTEIWAYQSTTDFNHPAFNQLKALTGQNGYIYGASMNALAYALKC